MQLRKSKFVWVENHLKKFHQNWPKKLFYCELALDLLC